MNIKTQIFKTFKYNFFLLLFSRDSIGCDLTFSTGWSRDWWIGVFIIRLSGVAVIADSLKFVDLLIACTVNYSWLRRNKNKIDPFVTIGIITWYHVIKKWVGTGNICWKLFNVVTACSTKKWKSCPGIDEIFERVAAFS